LIELDKKLDIFMKKRDLSTRDKEKSS